MTNNATGMKGRVICLLLALLAAGVMRAETPAKNGTIVPSGANTARVRNLVYLIGDGMGLAHVSMLQIEGGYAPTAFDRAQGVALLKTRSANNRVTDSAAAGTALACGCKTNNSTLGLDAGGRPLRSIMARAEASGMPAGIVVSCYLQHATPAAFYTHVSDRGDSRTITRDLLASGVDVLFGGGRKWLAEECPEGGTYLDAFRRRGYVVAGSMDEADTVHAAPLLAVVADKHLPGAAERGDYLPRATRKALELLAADAADRDTGFLLMVEGSQIDMAGHANDAAKLLDEMRDFEEAVAEAMNFADRTPGTLVVVTADHETGGLSISSNKTDFTLSESGLHYGFGTGSHSATMVPVFLYGTGASRIAGVMENSELARRIMRLMELE